MEHIVNNQSDINDDIYKPWFRNEKTFNTNCVEFQSYVKSVNEVDNKIQVDVEHPNVNSIYTDVNLDKNLVTYTLSHYDKYDYW